MHNQISTDLHELNQNWSGDKNYYEARKIVGALIQKITFSEWLPAILGTDGMKKLGLYKGYNPETTPSIANVFATAAFRFGHALIKPIIRRLVQGSDI